MQFALFNEPYKRLKQTTPWNVFLTFIKVDRFEERTVSCGSIWVLVKGLVFEFDESNLKDRARRRLDGVRQTAESLVGTTNANFYNDPVAPGGTSYFVDGQVSQFEEHRQEHVRDYRRAQDVRQVDGHELRAARVVLGADAEQRDRRHETGHQRERHRQDALVFVAQHVFLGGTKLVL